MSRTVNEGIRPPDNTEDHLYFPIDNMLKKIRNRRRRRQAAINILLTVAAVYLLFGAVLGIAVVKGDSMEPTLRENDMVLFLRIDVGYNPEDIVLTEAEDGRIYIKRIAAVPGQTVDINEETGTLLVDGTEASEPYVYTKTLRKTGMEFPYTLEEGEYLLLGDNRENSYDSRNYGPVREDDIKGRVFTTLRVGT